MRTLARDLPMHHPLRHLATRGLLMAALLAALPACSSSGITSDCETIAESYCARCFGCGLETTDGPVSGAALCDLPASITSQSTCVESLTDQCASQISSRQNSGDELDACLDAAESLKCAELYERHALQQRPAPQACQLLL